eukprot:CAMPEP_0194210920 /NCGR_PEP_ID=MMETSP0156-20130528/9186_1 /TAXON_ID=33649 /ORGANISM="Thalassionema nitzschioides, Strain L26-B" /LENGTH=130 /DNA_ID=CAMNT_0038938335 /DNA_START=69 /DNA_END=461 /DNA_ORIENTATION=-
MVVLRSIAVAFLFFCNGPVSAAPGRRAFIHTPKLGMASRPMGTNNSNEAMIMIRGGGFSLGRKRLKSGDTDEKLKIIEERFASLEEKGERLVGMLSKLESNLGSKSNNRAIMTRGGEKNTHEITTEHVSI